MSCECDNTVIQQVKVVVGIGNLLIQNGLTLSGNTLEWGGSPLLHNTDITGAFILNLGTNASRLTQGNIRANNQVLLDYNSGVVNASLLLASTGITLTDTTVSPKGLVGASDYSTNYTDNTYIQKIYGDTHLGTKLLSAIAITPTITQDHFYLQWDNTSSKYTLVATGVTVPGADTNVLFNDATALGASAKFTFNKTTGTLVSGDIHILGTSDVAGAVKSIQVQGTDTNISLSLLPKGTGSIILGNDIGGKVILGISGNTDTDKIIGVQGTQSNIAIRLQPKGTGILYVGDPVGSGNERIIQVDGTTTDISGRFKAKGAGSIYLTPGSGGQVIIGDIAVADTDYYLQTIGSGANRNLRISSNGTGRVIIDGYATTEVSIPAWNMDTTVGVTATIPNIIPSKIIFMSYVISNNAGTLFSYISTYIHDTAPGDMPDAGIGSAILTGGVNTSVDLLRVDSGIFDNANYNAFNSGKLTVVYRP